MVVARGQSFFDAAGGVLEELPDEPAEEPLDDEPPDDELSDAAAGFDSDLEPSEEPGGGAGLPLPFP
ncbi:MAG: hypothetical protein ACRD9L_19975 [Bryobacteraceae bacterium]